MSRMQLLGTLFCCLFLSAAFAFATDGTVLINQNTSVNGLPGCGSTGFPIIICKSGSYKLSGNLVIPAGLDGIHITADHVSVDLNGFSILETGQIPCNSGPNPCGLGIASSNSNVTIRNGGVSGFVNGEGLNLSGNDSAVDNVQATGNGSGVVIDSGSVLHCIVSHNTYSGIWALYNAVVISANTIAANGSGIYVTSATVHVTNNAIVGNTFALKEYDDTHPGRIAYGINTFDTDSPMSQYGPTIPAVSMKNNACASGPC